MYVDFAYYKTVCNGDMSEAEFESYEKQAEAYIRYLTYINGDIFATESDPVKMAVCTAADVIRNCDKETASGQGKIKSESNDGYSVSYAAEMTDGETAAMLARRRVYQAVRVYLLPTGWLSRRVPGNSAGCGGGCL